MRSFSAKLPLGQIAIFLSAMHLGCGDQNSQPQGTGGSGGASAVSATTSSGGSSGGSSSSIAPASSGGTTASGGETSSSSSKGQTTGTGGGTGTGGASPGGATGTGGKDSGSGGTTVGSGGTSVVKTTGTGGKTGGSGGAVGGASGTTSGNTGGQTGTPGSIPWGKKENPTASCTVAAMPEVGSFKANPKLPDPFTKMDGTRMTSKSEWACRREEILREGFAYIYGDKPIPATVTGTVSTTKITVNISDGGKTATINATVSMNGATQPAPAIIRYGKSGASAPTGVATIDYTPTETTGTSGAKSGAFFTIHGADHPAGYMVSNAWEISRIIDVLEQNPGIIDPYRVGVTGCSRWGKGAFVAGVLDNRIALTIPVESGIGGTVALRLVEQLDTSGEWPYHAISYVRWLSDIALGKFTSGNSANADNTDKLPVDMHEMMALIIPRGLYIVDNPSTNYAGLDKNSAWVTGNVGKVIFEALGYGDNFSLQGASGGHCQWRTQYTESLNAMVDKFLKGNASATTGKVATDFTGPDAKKYYDWTAPTLGGSL